MGKTKPSKKLKKTNNKTISIKKAKVAGKKPKKKSRQVAEEKTSFDPLLDRKEIPSSSRKAPFGSDAWLREGLKGTKKSKGQTGEIRLYNPTFHEKIPPIFNNPKDIEISKTKSEKPYDRRKGNHTGIAVIVNVNNIKKKKPRAGAVKDAEYLTRLLKQRNFDVYTLFNPKKEELEGAIEEIRKLNFEKADSFFLAVMGHGNGDFIKTADGEEFSVLEGLVKPFNNEFGPKGLKNKPKMFLFNYWRGETIDQDTMLDTDGNKLDKSTLTIPSWTDTLICYPCFDGKDSLRNEGGTWFVHTFCDVLRKHGDDLDVLELLNVVSEVMKSRFGTGNNKAVKQISPSYNIGFTRKFFIKKM